MRNAGSTDGYSEELGTVKPDTEAKDFAEFMRSKLVKKYISEITIDAGKAIGTAEGNLSYKGMSHYGSTLVGEYKSDLSELKRAEGIFNKEYTRLDSGAAKDTKAFTAAYHQYVINLDIIEMQNVNHSSLIKADFALMVAAAISLVNETSPLAVRLKLLNKNTADLIKELEKVNKSCKDKAVRAALTLPIKVLGAVIVPQTQIARVGWAVTTMATQTVISETISGSKSKTLSSAKTAGYSAWSAASALKRDEPTVAKSLKSCLLSIGYNSAVIGIDLAKIKNLRRRIEGYLSEYKALTKEFVTRTKDMKKAFADVEAAHRKALSALGSHTSHNAKRQELIAEVKSWDR